MSMRRGFAAIFGNNREANHHPQQGPSPPDSPRPGQVVAPVPPPMNTDDRIMSSEQLHEGIVSLETVLKTMNSLREQTNQQNIALREHARSLRRYETTINMSLVDQTQPVNGNIGEDKVSERLMFHCANYYDRLADAQEQLVYISASKTNLGEAIFGGI
jgi:hypothetical protein